MEVVELVAALERALREERFRPGERIGSERELAERFGVPRSQLRAAIEQLEAQHLLRRSMGRAGGVFADDGKIQRNLNTTRGLPWLVRQQGLDLQTRVVDAVIAQPFPDERRALGLGGDATVYRIRRVRSSGGATWSLDTSVLPARRYPGLLADDLTGSLYQLLAQKHGLQIDRAEETVEATPATAEQAQLLQIQRGSGLLEVRRITFDVQGAPTEYAHDFFRADRTRIHTQRLGANWKRTQSR